jgi:hypothetical protein
MKFKKIENIRPGDPDYVFYCSGCKCDHGVWTYDWDGPKWLFNRNVDYPTVSPSIKITTPSPAGIKICHSFINNGQIQYLDDCTHEFKGKTIDLPDYE